MSDFSLTLVLQIKTSKIINDIAKVSIKSEKITPFGGIFHVRELFSRFLGPVIDKVLGLRCTSYGYQYSEIVGSLSSVYFCGGGKERIFDDLNNGFGWARLPKSFMAENTVFLLLTAIIRNLYKFLMGRLDAKAFGLKKTSRIKAYNTWLGNKSCPNPQF